MRRSPLVEFVASLGFDVNEKGLKKFENSLENLTDKVKKVGLYLGAAGLAGYMVKALVDTASAADGVADSAKRIGIATNDLIRLQFAAESSDASVEGLTTGLRTLAKNAYDAGKGSGEAYDNFQKLGIRVKDATGKFKPANVLLKEVADKVAALPEGVERTAVAMNLLGKGGQELVPFLVKGGAAISELEAKADRFGLTLSQKTEKNVADFDDALTDLKHAQEGIFKRLLFALPGLNKLLVKLTEVFIKAQPFVGVFAEQLSKVLEVMGNLAELIARQNFFNLLVAGIGAASFAMKGLVAQALKAGISTAVSFAPMLVVMAALFLIIDEITTTLNGGDSLINRLQTFLLQDFKDSPILEAVASLLSLLGGLDSELRKNRFLKAIGFSDIPVVPAGPKNSPVQSLSLPSSFYSETRSDPFKAAPSNNSSIQHNTININGGDQKQVEETLQKVLLQAKGKAQQ